MLVSDLSDEEIERNTGVKLPPKNIEYIKRKNELRALERHVINIIFNLAGEQTEDSEEIKTLLRRRSLRMLMEEKAAKTRAEPRWSPCKKVGFRRTESEVRRNAPRRAEGKCSKLRHTGHRRQLTQLQRIESVRVEQVQHQWTELQQVGQEAPVTELQQATPQWVECVLIDPPQDTPVLFTSVESIQPQYTQIQNVTEVTVVQKISIYEEIIEETAAK